MGDNAKPASDTVLKPEENGSALLARRQRAILSFINNPEETLRLFPELRNELIQFFVNSVNPNADSNGQPKKGSETDFEKWEKARQWASEYARR